MDTKELMEKCKNPFFADANKGICEKLNEYLFDDVQKYINKNRECTLKDIMEETCVRKDYLMDWILTGRLKNLPDHLEEFKAEQVEIRNGFKQIVQEHYVEKMFEEAKAKDEKYKKMMDAKKGRKSEFRSSRPFRR